MGHPFARLEKKAEKKKTEENKMGVFRKLGLLLTLPILFVAVQFAYNQYMLTSLTYTLDPISPDDYVFDSELYSTLFNHTKWAHVDTFAVGVGIPMASLPKKFRDEEAFGAEVMTQLWDQRRTFSISHFYYFIIIL